MTQRHKEHKDTKGFFIANIRHVVLDIDGTIYKDSTLFDCTLPFLRALDAADIGHTFLTNNTSRSKKEYVEKLRGMGIQVVLDDLYTSADATIDYLNTMLPEVRQIALLGTPSLCEQFEEAGLVIDWNKPGAVVIAYDTTLDYERICKAAWWVSKGLPYIATHPDLICPTDKETILIDCGAICACIEAAIGGGRKPVILGKPEPSLLESIARRHNLKINEIAMIGDRLYTDIVMAQRAGAISILVLTGESTREDAERHVPLPDIIVDDLASLHGFDLRN